jgi:hypothetical protein
MGDAKRMDHGTNPVDPAGNSMAAAQSALTTPVTGGDLTGGAGSSLQEKERSEQELNKSMTDPTAASAATGGAIVDSAGNPLAAAQNASTTPSAGGDFTGDAGTASREKERLEEELSMAKALLMLNNVSVNMDFDEEDAPVGSAAEVVKLKGSRHLIQLLLTLKQKVSLLHQQYILLRGDMLYLNHEMNVCRHWILQSFRMAMQHQSQEHSSLQTRFERLSKVLT